MVRMGKLRILSIAVDEYSELFCRSVRFKARRPVKCVERVTTVIFVNGSDLISYLMNTAIAIGCMVAAGCTLGPKQIHRGRLEYNEAVQQSFREEMLLKLVRLRYSA